MDIKYLIYTLENNFTKSFEYTASVRFDVVFENSNVLIILEKLQHLHYNVYNNINTGKHVGYQININDVEIVQQTLAGLVNHYKNILNLNEIPLNLKLYNLLGTLREKIKESEQNNNNEQLVQQTKDLHQYFIGSKTVVPLSQKQKLENKINRDIANTNKGKRIRNKK